MNKISYVIIFALIVYMLISIIKLKDRNKENIIAYNDKIKTYVDKYNQVVVEKKAYEVSYNDIKKLNDSLRDIIKNYKPTTIVKWKEKYVYKDSIEIKYDTVINQQFTIPFDYNTKWLSLNGISTNLGISINNITIPNEQSVIIGYKRDNFFKPYYANVSIVNTNPHIQFNKIDSYMIKPKKTIFESWWFWGSVGLIGGILIAR